MLNHHQKCQNSHQKSQRAGDGDGPWQVMPSIQRKWYIHSKCGWQNGRRKKYINDQERKNEEQTENVPITQCNKKNVLRFDIVFSFLPLSHSFNRIYYSMNIDEMSKNTHISLPKIRAYTRYFLGQIPHQKCPLLHRRSLAQLSSPCTLTKIYEICGSSFEFRIYSQTITIWNDMIWFHREWATEPGNAFAGSFTLAYSH